jgi:uncharacterized Zn finger protein
VVLYAGCPYEDHCKHIAATLLACLREPEAVEERPPLEELLAPLDRDRLQALLLVLAAEQPGLIDYIERQIAPPLPVPQVESATLRRAPLDTHALRRQVRAALQPNYDRSNYGYAGDAVAGAAGRADAALYRDRRWARRARPARSHRRLL